MAVNIRNISIIAHVDHGKTTLTDTFALKAGLISEADAGIKRLADTRDDEKERGITIKSTGVAMTLRYGDADYKVNLVDSPGHVDFNSEVSAALRITDGAIVVVDSVEGVCVQTEMVLRQALAERVRPVLLINKLDRYFFELSLDGEEAYKRMEGIIAKVNDIVRTFNPPGAPAVELSPESGNVLFGCGLHRWGFSLRTFAEWYAAKSDIPADKWMSYLWGDWYVNKGTKAFTRTPGHGPRVFVDYLYKYLAAVCAVGQPNASPAAAEGAGAEAAPAERYKTVLTRFGVTLAPAERELTGKALYKAAMRRWLPLSEALMYATVVHLPSPSEAQKYRVDVLFDGPKDHPAYAAIRDCDPAAPLMLYVSKMIHSGEGGRFYAFGRVFSGTVTAGQKVDVLGSNYVPGSEAATDLARAKPVQRVLALVAARTEDVDGMPAGNTVALVGLEAYLLKSGTLTTFHDNPWPIRTMRLSVSPVVRVAVRAKNAADLPRLGEAVARLSKSDQCVVCTTQPGGGFVIAGAGELHVEVCLSDLRAFLKGGEIVTSPPVVPFRETVLALSSQVALAKSPNKHNRIFATAEPLPDAILQGLESGTLPAKDKVAIAKALTAAGHDTEAKRVLATGPEGEEANILIDCTSSVAYLTEARENIVGGFQQLVAAGVLAKEQMRGVLFKLVDASFHADSVHRGAGQVTPAAERAFSAAVLLASPRLVEPYYRCTSQVPAQWLGTMYSCLAHKRGRIVAEEHAEGTPVVTVHADLPVLESFGLNAFLQAQTSGQASTSLTFDHYEPVDADPLAPGTKAEELIKATRERKGIEASIPPLDRYLDRL